MQLMSLCYQWEGPQIVSVQSEASVIDCCFFRSFIFLPVLLLDSTHWQLLAPGTCRAKTPLLFLLFSASRRIDEVPRHGTLDRGDSRETDKQDSTHFRGERDWFRRRTQGEYVNYRRFRKPSAESTRGGVFLAINFHSVHTASGFVVKNRVLSRRQSRLVPESVLTA